MIKPIRVLQVFAQMNRGGAETMIMNLYRNIDRTKIQFDFIVHTDEACAYDEEIKKLGGNIYTFPKYTGKNHISYINSWKSFFNLHGQYRIIHGHVRSTAAIYLNIARKYNLTTIAHSHNTSSGSGPRALVKNVMQYPIRNTADYFFACSEDAGKWLFGNKVIKNNNFFIFKNAINTREFVYNISLRTRKRKEMGLDNKFVVGHVGRFHPQKNHDKLIDIFKEVHKRNSNAILLLIGDGELRNSIERKVNNSGLAESVIFTGARDDLPDLYQVMDVFVFPSLYEGLGIVAIEAQASGLPCVVGNTVPDETKITSNFYKIDINESSSRWAKHILNIQNSKRQNNYKYIKNKGYDIIDTVQWLENFYKELIDEIII